MWDERQNTDTGSTPKGLEQTNELKLQEIGFTRIGESSLFEKGDLVVKTHPDDTFALMVDYESNSKLDTVVGIKTGQFMGSSGFCLVTLHDEGGRIYAMERTLNGSGGGMRGEVPTPQEFEGKTFDNQLVDAGFTETSPGAFTLTVDERNQQSEVIAIVKDGQLSKVLKSFEPWAASHIDEKTKIVDFVDVPDDFPVRGESRPYSGLRLQNETMEFAISTQYGGRIVEGSQRLLRAPSPEEVGVKKFEAQTEASGFTVGGLNTTDVVQDISEINGISLVELERRMRPGSMSMAGFLGQDESLMEVMKADNDFVLQQGHTHQQLAAPLKYAVAMYAKQMGNEFEYNGQSYEMNVIGWRGSQSSPFNDGTGASCDMEITNKSNGTSIKFSFLLPEMIERYGFYEGKGTSYRLEPEDILEVFNV